MSPIANLERFSLTFTLYFSMLTYEQSYITSFLDFKYFVFKLILCLRYVMIELLQLITRQLVIRGLRL